MNLPALLFCLFTAIRHECQTHKEGRTSPLFLCKGSVFISKKAQQSEKNAHYTIFGKNILQKDIVLDSFIISNTPFKEVSHWAHHQDKTEFTRNHILFQAEKNYIDELFGMMRDGD